MSVSGKLQSTEDGRRLLAVARATAVAALGGEAAPVGERPRVEGTYGGAFVTFWSGRSLRGCMGRFAQTDDIVRTVEEVTKSTLDDPRFASCRVTAEELPSLNIEVSILSDLEPTSEPASLTPGTHGIMVRHGMRSGCFLPKVASDRGWSAEEFLTNCCSMKAGLPADAWRHPDTDVLLFTADVFLESDFA